MATERETKSALIGEEVVWLVGIGRAAGQDSVRRSIRQNGVDTDDR
jgi:hypothetical protein